MKREEVIYLESLSPLLSLKTPTPQTLREMAKSNSTTPKSADTYTPSHCPKTGRKFTKDERRANNKAKWLAEQAAKAKARKADKAKAKASKPKSKPKSAPVAKQADRIPVADVQRWMEQHPQRKTVSTVDITDWMASASNTKTGKRLANKGKIDSQMSKRNGKLEVQAQRKGGTVAA